MALALADDRSPSAEAMGDKRVAPLGCDAQEDWLSFCFLVAKAAEAIHRRGARFDIAACLRGSQKPSVDTFLVREREAGEPIGFMVASEDEAGLGERVYWIEGLFLLPGHSDALSAIAERAGEGSEERRVGK